MKRFEFKLQPLLNYRKYLEQVARQNTAKASMDVENCAKQIVYLKQTYDQKVEKIEDIVANGVNAFEFRLHNQYLNAVENSIEDEKSRKIELQKILQEKLLELKKRSVDKKAMELYREKLKHEYTQEVLTIEQKELDEISSIKTARKLSNETI
ncbi:flagellar export protein FliJ [Desulfobacula toluolica]|uniref:Flagellar FliJ protein n=1 Tax=Desulfobacula toluolica (strain DSM 7467 / Tol2) TaxID=651182 RepID=K0NBM2_DESTT|nr:flagellar FliJ family protein [Desulfobacula toluolica]CCK81739.1 FliJ: predicted flagellar chaperone escort protein [Desulfobacula toluolica Tol2]